MAKKTIITCDVTGKEGAETVELMLYKRVPDPASHARCVPHIFGIDLSPAAKTALITFLAGRLPGNELSIAIEEFFSRNANPELAEAMAERLRGL